MRRNKPEVPFGINDIPANHYIAECNGQIISSPEFSPEFALAKITNSDVILSIFNKSIWETKFIPTTIQFVLHAGYQNDADPENNKPAKGYSALHVIRRGHIVEKGVHNYFKKENQCLDLIWLLKEVLKNIDQLFERDDIALEWAPKECAYTLVVKTPMSFRTYQYVLCTFYPEAGSRLVLVTAYPGHKELFDYVKQNKQRYESIPRCHFSTISKVANENNNSNINNLKEDDTYSDLEKKFSKASAKSTLDTSETASYGELLCDKNLKEANNEAALVQYQITKHIQELQQDITRLKKKMDPIMLEQSLIIKDCNVVLEQLEKSFRYVSAISMNDPICDRYMNEIPDYNMKLASLFFRYESHVKRLENQMNLKEKTIDKLHVIFSMLGSSFENVSEQLISRNVNFDILPEHQKIFNQFYLLHCEYLKKINAFLIHAVKYDVDISRHASQLSLLFQFETFYEEDLKKACSKSNNDVLLQIYKTFLKKFEDKYEDVINNSMKYRLTLRKG